MNKPLQRRHLIAYRLLGLAFLSLLVVLGAVVVGGGLQAGGTTTALYTVAVNITNTGSSDLDDIQAPFTTSGAALIDGDYMASNALNAIIHRVTTDIPSMPATNRIQVEGAVQEAVEAFTEYTSAAQNTTANDVQLLPSSPTVEDAFYFGFDNPSRILTLDIDTAGVGTWTLTWEYWDGDSFEALANVDDRTNGFTLLGRHTASWDMPTDWAPRTVTGSAVTAFWSRARLSAFTTQTTQPLASRGFYENGQWWVWVEDLDVNVQEQLTLHLGGATDLVTAHQIFPGSAGIVTNDAATLEFGNAYSIGVVARLDFSSAGASACILCKTSAITVNVSGSASNPVIGTVITGGGTSTGDTPALTMPATGEQTIIVASDGSNAGTFANAGGMSSYSAQTITDNANNLTWASNGGVDYIESIRVDTVSPTVFNFETVYADFNGGTHTNTQAYTGALGLDNQ